MTILFLTEMWERFSFYGMRALLILYMTQVLLPAGMEQVAGLVTFNHLSQHLFGPIDPAATASQIYGLYIGFVYFTPVFGGFIADRWLGRTRTIILGGLLMIAGHMLLIWQWSFLLALLLLIVGTGCFKGNITVQVGELYAQDDPRRERGFSIFYFGINLGTALAPLACAWVAARHGWTAAFDLTTVGMVLGLFIYLWNSRAGTIRSPATPVSVDHVPQLAGAHSRESWLRYVLVTGLALVPIWMSYEQQANAMMRWVAAATGGGGGLAWLQAIPGVTVLVMTPVLTRYWSRQARRSREPGPSRKIAIGGVIFASAQFALAAIAAWAPSGAVLLLSLALYMAFWEIGDLYMSPATMSAVSRLAPPDRAGTAMALYFMAYFVGSILSGWFGGFWGKIGSVPYWLIIAALTTASALAFFARERALVRQLAASSGGGVPAAQRPGLSECL